MILSLLLRSTLLLLAANHSIAQEWYVQDNGPEYYAAPSIVQDTQPSFLEKREAEPSANESKTVYLSDHYAPYVRQKRDSTNDDNYEQRSSDVTEYASNDVSDHVDDHVSEEKGQPIDPNSSLDTNGYSDTNNSYEYTHHRDTNTSYDFVDSKQGGFKSNETTGKILEDTATNPDNDVMDEAEEPTSDHAERSETKPAGNEAQQGSGKSYYQEDDKNTPINKVENNNKQERENATEAEESDQEDNVVGKEKEEKKTTTSLGEDGSGEQGKEDEWLRGDDDDDEYEDEQPVKRQNLGMKIIEYKRG